MKLLATIIPILVASATAHANPTFYNATPNSVIIEATSPNGKVTTATLRDGSYGVSQHYFLVALGVDQLSIKISDDLGAELWKGTVGKDDVHAVIPDGKGSKVIYAGSLAGTSTTPKASLFINITGTDLTVDLEGMNGIGAHRGIKPKAAFDLKDIVRLDPKETYFHVTIKPKDGEPVKLKGNRVGSGRYYLISKHPRDKYRILSLGHVLPPKK